MRTPITRTAFTCASVVALFFMVGCATAPNSPAERQSLVASADATVASMTAKDPSLRNLLDRSPGYAVFPDVGAAGAIVGGAFGRGVVFENGRPVGFAKLTQGSVGATLGGQSYSEMMVFQNEAALNRLKAGNFDLGAEAQAVALKAGLADATEFEGGVAIFQMPKGGLMASAAVTGQKVTFQASQDQDVSGSDAVTAGAHQSADHDSAYTVDRDLQPNDELRLRTERTEDNTHELKIEAH